MIWSQRRDLRVATDSLWVWAMRAEGSGLTGGPVTFLPALSSSSKAWTMCTHTHTVLGLVLPIAPVCHRRPFACHTVCAETGSRTPGRISGSRAAGLEPLAIPPWHASPLRVTLFRFQPVLTEVERGPRTRHTNPNPVTCLPRLIFTRYLETWAGVKKWEDRNGHEQHTLVSVQISTGNELKTLRSEVIGFFSEFLIDATLLRWIWEAGTTTYGSVLDKPLKTIPDGLL